MVSVTVAAQFADLEQASRGVTLWIAGLPPRTLAMAQAMTRWDELEAAGRLHPTALAAMRAYIAR